jgi:hypothetical protein
MVWDEPRARLYVADSTPPADHSQLICLTLTAYGFIPTNADCERNADCTKPGNKDDSQPCLKSSLDLGVFAGNEKNSLDCDLLVINESSMVDVPLMSDLLQGIPRTQISFWSVM